MFKPSMIVTAPAPCLTVTGTERKKATENEVENARGIFPPRSLRKPLGHIFLGKHI